VLSPVAITLRAMRFHALVGILPHERELPQPLEIDLTAWVAAGHTPPVDYRALYAETEHAVGGAHGYLEELAATLADRAMTVPGVERVAVAVRKPHVALPGPLAYAEVRLERARAD
jgi:dihydroneopterin aldolase